MHSLKIVRLLQHDGRHSFIFDKVSLQLLLCASVCLGLLACPSVNKVTEKVVNEFSYIFFREFGLGFWGDEGLF